MFVKNDLATYFNGFRVKYITKEIKKVIGHKNITITISRKQANYSMMCG